MASSKHWKTYGVVFLCLAGFRTPLWDGERSPSFEGSISKPIPASHHSRMVVDFDGDRISDLAIGRAEDSCFRVEIHLSTQPGNMSVRGGDVVAGMSFLAYDIDHDNDQDLILASFNSLSPASVWLNDGKGHFDESKQVDGFRIVRKDPLAVQTESPQAEPVIFAQDDDRPFDKSSIFQATVALSATRLVSSSSKGFVIEVGPCHFSPRGPPLIPAFLS